MKNSLLFPLDAALPHAAFHYHRRQTCRLVLDTHTHTIQRDGEITHDIKRPTPRQPAFTKINTALAQLTCLAKNIQTQLELEVYLVSVSEPGIVCQSVCAKREHRDKKKQKNTTQRAGELEGV